MHQVDVLNGIGGRKMAAILIDSLAVELCAGRGIGWGAFLS